MTANALRCAPGIFLAQVDEDVIVLDLANDRYDGLFDAAGLMSLDGQGRLIPADDEVRTDLIATGLATEGDGENLSPAVIPARRELAADPRPPRRDIWRAAVVLATATLRFRNTGLKDLVCIAHRLRGPAPAGDDRISQLVGAARVARTWVPSEGECLQRSFLLRSYLASQGVATDWVFGVRTWPFAAHCWLQIGDLVVGDRLARVSRFTPIMRA